MKTAARRNRRALVPRVRAECGIERGSRPNDPNVPVELDGTIYADLRAGARQYDATLGVSLAPRFVGPMLFLRGTHGKEQILSMDGFPCDPTTLDALIALLLTTV